MFNYDKVTRTKHLEKTTIIQGVAYWMLSVWVLHFLIGESALFSPVFVIVYLLYMFVKVTRDNNRVKETVEKHPSLSELATKIYPNKKLETNVYLVESGGSGDSQPPELLTMSSFKRDSPIITTPGLIETLNKPELEAAIAHEVSHIKNRHTSKLLVLSTLQLVTYLNVFIGIVGTVLHVIGFEILLVSGVSSIEAVGAVTGLVIFGFLVTVMNTTTRIYQEHIADADAAAHIGDTLTYIEMLETFADNVREYDEQYLNHRKDFLYKIDSMVYQNK